MAVFTPEFAIATYVAKLGTIAGVGLVYDYRRVVRDEAGARALWADSNGQINAWSVSLDETPITTERGPGFGAVGSGQAGTVITGVRLAIDGVYGIDDAQASEKTFRALVWDVMHAINGEGKLANEFSHQEPMTWDRFGYQTLAGMYTVHFARLRTSVIGRTRP